MPKRNEMKKILFVAIAAIGFTTAATAQKKAAASTMTPAPTQEQVAKETRVKSQGVESKKAVTTTTKYVDPNVAKYKKAGLNQSQINSISSSVKQLEDKKVATQNDESLTPEQKKNRIAAIEAEKNHMMKSKMGVDTYNKFTGAAKVDPNIKPVKSVN